MSKASRERGEIKREAIGREIFACMERCVNEKMGLDKAVIVVQAHIKGMERRNPQESHLVRSVCYEIRSNHIAFFKGEGR